MWAVAAFAVVALVVDVVVHVGAVVGLNPQDWIRPGWVAVVGFWALFTAVVAAGNAVEARRRRRAEAQGVALPDDDNPLWFKRVRRVVVIYAVINLVVFGLAGRGQGDPTRQRDGAYVLETGHGRAAQPITVEEYDRYRRNSVRAVSAFVLMFYLQIAFDMVWLAAGKGKDAVRGAARRRTGHWVYVVWWRGGE